MAASTVFVMQLFCAVNDVFSDRGKYKTCRQLHYLDCAKIS